MVTATRGVELVYPVPETDPRWVLEDDDNMPESAAHGAIVDLLKDVLKTYAARTGRDALVVSNVALRWDEARPKVGVDPDVMWIEPSTPGGEFELRSLCTWKPGHAPPRVAVEVVSLNSGVKDYGEGPDKYAASGTRELWVFDADHFGLAIHGGPWVLQVWRRSSDGRFAQVYAGGGPARSEELGAWLVVTDDGRQMRLADDPAGEQLWPTASERERERAEQERERAERAQAETVGALAEIARLRVELARVRGR